MSAMPHRHGEKVCFVRLLRARQEAEEKVTDFRRLNRDLAHVRSAILSETAKQVLCGSAVRGLVGKRSSALGSRAEG
jgi:hypothetical protein